MTFSYTQAHDLSIYTRTFQYRHNRWCMHMCIHIDKDVDTTRSCLHLCICVNMYMCKHMKRYHLFIYTHIQIPSIKTQFIPSLGLFCHFLLKRDQLDWEWEWDWMTLQTSHSHSYMKRYHLFIYTLIQPIVFGVSFNSILILNLIGLFATGSGKRDLEKE